MRREAKALKHTKCALTDCRVGTFKKNKGYYRDGEYFCGKTHYRGWKEGSKDKK